MSGIAATLQHKRDLRSGVGSAGGQAVRYLGQDYAALREQWLGYGRLFEDDSFPASSSALGFNDLGPRSAKVRGVTWMRPTVPRLNMMILILISIIIIIIVKSEFVELNGFLHPLDWQDGAEIV